MLNFIIFHNRWSLLVIGYQPVIDWSVASLIVIACVCNIYHIRLVGRSQSYRAMVAGVVQNITRDVKYWHGRHRKQFGRINFRNDCMWQTILCHRVWSLSTVLLYAYAIDHRPIHRQGTVQGQLCSVRHLLMHGDWWWNDCLLVNRC